ncbi:MAG: outer membrane protein transport protein, partial [Leptospirales bacterium]|nr:outer membrane protein transport protein [Leptospirales bacterium]
PAGTAFLSEGFHVDLSGQTLFKFYRNEDVQSTGWTVGAATFPTTKESLKQDYPTPILPNLFLVYNFGAVGPGKLAAYLQAGIVAGGGELKWKDGTAGTTFLLNGMGAKIAAAGGGTYVNGGIKSQEFTASSIYYGTGIGASYAFLDDMVSFSLGGRMVMAQRSFELEAAYATGAGASVKYEYDAKGFTPIIGVNVKPTKELTLAARFEAQTALEFKYKQKKLDGSLNTYAGAALTSAGIVDGKKTRQDLPPIVGLGAQYKVNDQLTLDLSGTIYMLSLANMGHVYDDGAQVGKTNKYFGTGWEVALGATYKVLEQLKVGGGVMYTESGAKKKYLNDTKTIFNASANPSLDSITIGLGATYAIMDNLDFTLSAMWAHYFPENFSVSSPPVAVSGKYSKDVIDIAYGVGYKL